MPISCHFQDCKALLGATSSTGPLPLSDLLSYLYSRRGYQYCHRRTVHRSLHPPDHLHTSTPADIIDRIQIVVGVKYPLYEQVIQKRVVYRDVSAPAFSEWGANWSLYWWHRYCWAFELLTAIICRRVSLLRYSYFPTENALRG